MKTKLEPQDIINAIDNVSYYNKPGTTHTTCYIKLKNGCIVTGESACVDPANYLQSKGEEIAYTNAKSKIWQLEGYLLMNDLFVQKLLTTARASDSQEAVTMIAGIELPKNELDVPKITAPTVGRVVYYYPEQAEYFEGAEVGEPLASIICHVFDEHTINLAIFGPSGVSHARSNVTLLHPEYEQEGNDYNEQDDVGGYAKWMPYQVKAAKKYPVT